MTRFMEINDTLDIVWGGFQTCWQTNTVLHCIFFPQKQHQRVRGQLQLTLIQGHCMWTAEHEGLEKTYTGFKMERKIQKYKEKSVSLDPEKVENWPTIRDAFAAKIANTAKCFIMIEMFQLE